MITEAYWPNPSPDPDAMTPKRQACGIRLNLRGIRRWQNLSPKQTGYGSRSTYLPRYGAASKVAAAAEDLSVSAYVTRFLARAVPAGRAVRRTPDGIITTETMHRFATLRAEQATPFPEDSADLIREARPGWSARTNGERR